MIGAVRRRVGSGRSEAGFTLIELLVASAMGVILLGAVGSLVISAMRTSRRSAKRHEHHDRALGAGAADPGDPQRHRGRPRASDRLGLLPAPTCAAPPAAARRAASSSPAIKCEVTYRCTTTSCSRTETAPGVYTGHRDQIFKGIDNSNVFSYSPERGRSRPTSSITLRIPQPERRRRR